MIIFQRNGQESSDIESLLEDDIMISRLSEAQYLEHINFEAEIEKFKGMIFENLSVPKFYYFSKIHGFQKLKKRTISKLYSCISNCP